MESMTIAVYLKGLLSPEIAVDFVRLVDKDVNSDELHIEYENAMVNFVSKVRDDKTDFKEVVSSFYNLVKVVATRDFYHRIAGVSIYDEDIDEFDNLVYLFVGVCAKNDIQKECTKDFITNVIKAGISGKSFKSVIKEYKNKDCKSERPTQPMLPKTIGGYKF